MTERVQAYCKGRDHQTLIAARGNIAAGGLIARTGLI
jgi:hypothetical protein